MKLSNQANNLHEKRINMMKKILAAAVFAAIFISCGPAGEGSEVPETDSQAIPQPLPTSGVAALEGCYRMTIQKDTAGMQLRVLGDSISGNLFYHWYARDHNDGEVAGQIRDSVIHAYYRFQSEGLTSVREVIFKFSADTLYQGYGDVTTVNDTVRFKFPQHVVFDRKNPFIKVACADSAAGGGTN